MKKIAFAALLAASFGAHADVATFDSFANEVAVTNGYAGVNWNNFYTIDGVAAGYPTSGYAKGAVSGSMVALNWFGAPATVSAIDGSGFDLNNGYFTAAWNNGLTVSAAATFENGTTATKSFTVNPSGPSLESFGWTDLKSVTFTSFGGTDAGLGGGGNHFAVDNLNFSAAVPEPAETSLLLAGLGAIALVARRRKQA
ncbi:MAG: PEP-CTERM sorting domain-containing protein [Burkholderiaceae bacterium]